jgi:hypothetical protein
MAEPKKSDPLRQLNKEFEDDLKIGGLFRRYRDMGKELLALAAEINLMGFVVPDVEREGLIISVFDMAEMDD